MPVPTTAPAANVESYPDANERKKDEDQVRQIQFHIEVDFL